MKIEDILSEEDSQQDSQDSKSVDLSDVEKTAELLDALSEEDDFIDKVAQLAVFQAQLEGGGKNGSD